jgi:hypothetical protein
MHNPDFHSKYSERGALASEQKGHWTLWFGVERKKETLDEFFGSRSR